MMGNPKKVSDFLNAVYVHMFQRARWRFLFPGGFRKNSETYMICVGVVNQIGIRLSFTKYV